MSKRYKTIINNRRVNLAIEPKGQILQSAAEIFYNEESMIRTTGNHTLRHLSENILHTLGVTMLDSFAESERFDDEFESAYVHDPIESYNKNFSFMSIKNNDEGIDNPNILDPDFMGLKPKLISAADKFISVADPFYEQDEEKSESTLGLSFLESEKRKKPLVAIAADLTQPHLSRHTSNQNRYFANKIFSLRRGGR
jgi:hypothetical protein